VLRFVLTAAILVAVVFLVGVLVLQERMAYQPPHVVQPTPAGAERVDYVAADGQPLYAYLIPGAAGGGGPPRVLLAFHGNADLAAWVAPWGREVARRTGRTVVLAEYRGYGGLTGSPSAPGVRADSRAALEFVRARFGVGAHIAYYGHSLGSAVATELASDSPPEVLVLESPFTSARTMAARYGTPIVSWLWPLIGRIPYDTEMRVRTLDVPVWVAHGDRDMIVPTRMGRAVFAAAKDKGELLIVPGASHNGVADVGGDAYWSWLTRALR
jgi:pimeloyl-ACP methyl ester carboxylesterase